MHIIHGVITKIWSGVAVLAYTMLFIMPLVARAQSATSDNTEPYRHAYDLSPVLFDDCGDAARGELIRQVIRQKVEGCPFAESEKAGFRTWATTRNAQIASEDHHLTQQNTQRCTQTLTDPSVKLIRQRLDAYGRGQLSANGVIEEVCRPMTP